MNNTYSASDLFEDIPGDPDNVLLNIPPEICEQAGFQTGDTINIKVENGRMILSKV